MEINIILIEFYHNYECLPFCLYRVEQLNFKLTLCIIEGNSEYFIRVLQYGFPVSILLFEHACLNAKILTAHEMLNVTIIMKKTSL